MNNIFYQVLSVAIFLAAIFFHGAKKNFEIAVAYGIQSLAIVFILFISLSKASFVPTSLLVIFLVLVVKVVIVPRFFIALIKKHELRFSATTYLNFPLTLVVITVLTFMAHGWMFKSLASIAPENAELLSLALSIIFISIFLMINRKGALSQMVGILSLENGIVAFATFSGLEQSIVLQVGILFDIVVWLVIATVFASMIYGHFGSLDVTTMKNLKD